MFMKSININTRITDIYNIINLYISFIYIYVDIYFA